MLQNLLDNCVYDSNLFYNIMSVLHFNMLYVIGQIINNDNSNIGLILADIAILLQ